MGTVYFKIRVNGYARTAADTPVTVEFEQSTYTVAESDDSSTTDMTENEVEVKVTLSADPGRTVIIPITTTNEGGATSSDYSGVPTSVHLRQRRDGADVHLHRDRGHRRR